MRRQGWIDNDRRYILVESFIVTCEKDELLLNIVCTTTAMESAPSVDADVDGDDDSDGDRIGKKDKD